MTWLTWRQFRVPLLSVYAALAVVAVVLTITGPGLVGRTSYADQEVWFGGTALLLYLLPAVVGVFWGVPLVTRELETGTHNLVWNQSTTRTRWLAVKLGFGTAAAAVAAGLLSAAVSWWADPIDTLADQQTDYFGQSRLSPVIFTARGIVPVGYAVFAFVLGIAVGFLLRRTVTAMAVTLVVLAAVLLAVPVLVRPHLVTPVEQTVPITESAVLGIKGNADGVVDELILSKPAGAWMIGNETLDPSGLPVSPLPASLSDCLPKPGRAGGDVPHSFGECVARLGDLGYTQRFTYHPPSHFWPLQWLETGLFLALSALLAWFCFRRVRQV